MIRRTIAVRRRRGVHRRLALESLEARQLLAATQIVTSPDGSVVIGADFTSTEVRAFGWTEPITDITYDTGLPSVDGFFRTDTDHFTLAGTAPSSVGSVVVAGAVASWSAETGQWSRADIPLNPGINRIYIQTYSGPAGTGEETDRHYVDIWYDTSGNSGTRIDIPMGSTWEYMDDGTDQGTEWRVNDPAPPWPTGPAQLGYGDGDEATVLDDGAPGNIPVTTYFRHKFNIPAGQAELLNHITIDLLYDDGGVVYINGTEVARTDTMPGTLGDDSIVFDTWADEDGTRENEITTFVVPQHLVSGLLQDGENVIAVEIHQHDEDSSDTSFDLSLRATEAGGVGIQPVSGTLPAGTTTWRAEDGPYLITSDLMVPAGATLEIEPGTTVYFTAGQELQVQGRLVAEGTIDEVIRFTREPGTTGVSGGIQFDGTMEDNRITYAVIEHGGTASNDGLIGLDQSNLLLDRVVLAHGDRRRIRSIESSLIVRNSVFTDIFAPNAPPTTDNISEQIWGGDVPPDGHFIIENNIFGTTAGHNDIIDFDASFRPAAIPQILNNTFVGGGDDAMDFEGDVHIEGNLITNFVIDQYNLGAGNSNGISAGGLVPEGGYHYVMTRNIFLNVEQVAQVKENAFMTFVNNTVVNADAAGLYFLRPTGGVPGDGAHVVGNIFYDTPTTFDEVRPETNLSVDYSVVAPDWVDAGTGNTSADPLLADPYNLDFHLLPGSPASGTGFNGSDMGALIPAGATIAGEPDPITTQTSATLTVGGADLLGYRYRVNGGPWSAPVEVSNFGTASQVIPPIELTDLPAGHYTVYVQKQNSAGAWQAEAEAARSRSWTVQGTHEPAITLATRDSYLPGVPFLVRVEISGEHGKPDRHLWDATVQLESSNPNVTLSADQVQLYNGLGSVLVTINGTEDFTLTATSGDMHAQRPITSLAGIGQTEVAGTLSGTESTWSGIVHVTDDVVIPAGHTLTIEPGTLVLIDGTTGALDENGTSIDVFGTVQSLGTAEQPITLTASSISAPWGELNHDNAGPSLYRHTEITRAGHAPRGGHTNTGPAIRSEDSAIELDHVSITDIAGKTMQVDDSELVFDNILFSRSVMGPEIEDSSLLMIDSYVLDMLGIYHERGTTDDNDGIYLHAQAPGQEIRISNSVFANVDDDAIDTLGSDIVLEYSIVRDADNTQEDAKGLSMIQGENVVRHTLFVNNTTGISLKAQSGDLTGTVYLDHVTMVGSDLGVFIEDKFGIPNANLRYVITNSIIQADDAIDTDYDPADIEIRYSHLSESWPGDGNIMGDPGFVNAVANDYRLSPSSLAVDAGDPSAPPDPDGTRTDMGALPLFQVSFPGDFDNNGVVDDLDIDALTAAIRGGEFDEEFDLTGDEQLDGADTAHLVRDILGTEFGDANLDGQVDGTDFDAWQASRFMPGGWANGDFNGDGLVDGQDFNIWWIHRFTAAQGASSPSAATGRTPRSAMAATPIVASNDGNVVIGADFTSTEVRTYGWTEPFTDITYDTGLPTVNGYFRTADDHFTLTGTAPTSVGSVLVAGSAAAWSQETGEWSRMDIPLHPGINRIYIQTYSDPNGTGDETERHYVDIWYDTSGTSGISVSIPMGSVWEYLDDGSNQGTAWRANDPVPAWPTGPAQLGYGDDDEATEVNDGPSGNVFVTTYFRHKFNIPAGQAELLTHITIDLLYDDGGAVYINGTEVARTETLPGTLGDNSVRYNTWADEDGTRENDVTTFVVPQNLVPGLLRDGENVIAVEIHQHDDDSSDMSFDLALWASEGVDESIQQVSGTLPLGTTTWRAEDGPYLVTSDVMVPAGATLVIEPGTTVYFNGGQELAVEGRLLAVGTVDEVIRFTRQPGSASIWGGIQFEDTMADNRIEFAVLEYGGTTNNNGMIGAEDSKLLLNRIVMAHNDRLRVRTDNTSLIIRNSVFGDTFPPNSPPTTDNDSEHLSTDDVPLGGEFIIENNIFGTTAGHNDVIDMDAGLRPDPIPQILNNTFLGGGDDAIDFGGDVHIEGNLFMNFVLDEWNTGTGNANGISAGGVVEDSGHHYVVTRNIFVNVQNVAQVNEGAFMTFVNNTVINSSAGGLYFQRPTGGAEGRGAHTVGNIFYNTPTPFDEVVPTTELSVHHSIVTPDWVGFGTGNVSGDPLFADLANFDFNLLPGSPAIGTGWNGTDMGALIPAGATINGEPDTLTPETTATLTIGGPDILAYRYRVNNGSWSLPIAVTSFGTNAQVIPPVSLADLAPGRYTVDVVAQNSAGVWQPEGQATRSESWIVEFTQPAEVDQLCSAIHAADADVRADLNGDENVDASDLDYLILELLETSYADINLDHQVDATDLMIWQSHRFTSGNWSEGDANCDGVIDGRDFNVWLANRFVGPRVGAAEPAAPRRTPRAPAAGDRPDQLEVPRRLAVFVDQQVRRRRSTATTDRVFAGWTHDVPKGPQQESFWQAHNAVADFRVLRGSIIAPS